LLIFESAVIHADQHIP